MKKIAVAKLLVVATAGLLTQGAMADGGTVNFNGQIVDSPCSIDPSSENIIVPMGTVSRTVLNGAAGKKSTPSKFRILLTNCGASAKGATVTFTGKSDGKVTDNLAINNAGQVGSAGDPTSTPPTASSGVVAATGVSIELGDSAGTKIPVGSASKAYVLGVGDNPLQFQAAYVSTGATVTAGPANSTAQFVVSYL